jgi:hypothetical protein
VIARTTSEGRRAWLLRTDRAAMLLSLSPGGALLLDHWGADGESAQCDSGWPTLAPTTRAQCSTSQRTGRAPW